MSQQTQQVKPFEKVLHLGTINACTVKARVFVKVRWDGKALSLTGVEGPKHNGNAVGSCGQIQQRAFESYAPGWTGTQVDRLFAIWKQYHLNDLQAGCEHQQALGWTSKEHLSKVCPMCGYAYGSAWLYKEVPETVLEELCQLPDADVQPAWV